jgi:hypothetical protein
MKSVISSHDYCPKNFHTWHRIGAKNGKIGVKTVKFGAEIDTNFSTTNQTIKTDIDS